MKTIFVACRVVLTLLAVVMLAACSPPAAPGRTDPALVSARAPAHTPVVFDRARFGTVERDITYCTVDSIPLKMDVHYPPVMSGRWPVVVYVHGGSWSAGSKTQGVGMVDAPELLKRGYLVVSVDYRLAPRWKFPAQLEDVKCAIRFLRANAARFNLDPKRVGAWGHSAGGHLVAMLGTTDRSADFEGSNEYADQSSRVQAVVDMSGRADLAGMPEQLAVSVFAHTITDTTDLQRDSPVTFVSPDDPPFLILHGEEDNVVPPRVSQELAQRLQTAHVPVTLVIVKNADHVFNPVGGPMSPPRADITQMIADFFDRYLH